ncbi:MAG: helix-turn-helix transcriptional regulator [Lentisphaeria bacterium]|nr:helix-turn-helix transcriptional regulator [Lentisphaeria bacterium]
MVKKDFCSGGDFIPLSTDVPLNIMLRWYGHQYTTRKSYFFDGIKRGSQEFTLWQYTLSGCGMVEFDGKFFPVNPGEAFLLTIPEHHRYYLPETSTHWEFLYLGFSGSEAMRIAGELRKKFPPVSSAFASDDAVDTAKKIICCCQDKTLNDPAEASALSYRFMMALVSGSRFQHTLPQDDPLLRVHQFCLEHLAEDISVEKMADFAGYSRSHFCRVFTALAKKSPHEYLLELRVRMAVRMLQNNDLSVKEIAAACGFAETGYFCKVFRRFYHTTPASFRKKHQIQV